MRQVARIDSSGFFEADVLLEDGAPLECGYVESGPPDGFFRPRWNPARSEWVEGASDQELLQRAYVEKHRELVSAATQEFVNAKPGYTAEERQLQLAYDLYSMITTGSSAGMSGEADALKAIFDRLYEKLVALEAARSTGDVEQVGSVSWS